MLGARAERALLGLTASRAISSAGRAPPRQGGGHWFEPSIAHLRNPRIRGGFVISGSGLPSIWPSKSRIRPGARVWDRGWLDLADAHGVLAPEERDQRWHHRL